MMNGKNVPGGNPIQPPPAGKSMPEHKPGGQVLPKKPAQMPTVGQQPEVSEDVDNEMLKKLVSRMAEQDPAGLAEIIRMWLKEDKTR
ncbi:MAG: hypothetical protein HPY45_16275 [Anaerolineae bacterium]|nr:hypothetical protein [Anaerolineae bacterium]